MSNLTASLLQGMVLLFALVGLLSFVATLFVLWLFLTMRDEPEDEYAGMHQALLTHAEELRK